MHEINVRRGTRDSQRDSLPGCRLMSRLKGFLKTSCRDVESHEARARGRRASAARREMTGWEAPLRALPSRLGRPVETATPFPPHRSHTAVRKDAHGGRCHRPGDHLHPPLRSHTDRGCAFLAVMPPMDTACSAAAAAATNEHVNLLLLDMVSSTATWVAPRTRMQHRDRERCCRSSVGWASC